MEHFNNPVSRMIWETRYKDPEKDITVEDTWKRIASALAKDKDEEAAFYDVLSGFSFLPAGRIQTSVGSDRNLTGFNCFVMDDIDDSMKDIFRVLQESAMTQKMGGGVGYNFSTIRPEGFEVESLKSPAGGPISFMRIFDATTKTIVGVGNRQGAQMGVMRVDHPDILKFIHAKKGKENKELEKFNISVSLTDKFMRALRDGSSFPLMWGDEEVDRLGAIGLMNSITENAYTYAEPGVLFIDRINQWNNLYYCEDISAVNPCGEQSLPPYGACLLGSINLAAFVEENPEYNISTHETKDGFGKFNFTAYGSAIREAVKMLDHVIDETSYPLPQQETEAKSKRRMGVGVTGFASALAMMGVEYGSEECMEWVDEWGSFLRDTAYSASIDLAMEDGPFPAFDKNGYLGSKFVKTLPKHLRDQIAEHGIRNSHLLSIAPTGTISLEANCVSHSIEPDFALSYHRNVRMKPGSDETETVEIQTYAYKWLKERGLSTDHMRLANEIHPKVHIDVQAKWQEYVDSSISKTINVAEDYPYEDFKDLYLYAYQRGCKGLTLYRPNEKMDSVIVLSDPNDQQGELKEKKGKGKRPLNLYGATYKVKYRNDRGPLYITINRDPDRPEHPYEILINHDNGGESEVWLKALAKMLSAVMTRSDSLKFVIDSFKDLRDGEGGEWQTDINVKGALHRGSMYDGYTPPIYEGDDGAKSVYVKSGPHAISLALQAFQDEFGDEEEDDVSVNGDPATLKTTCPQCGEKELVKESGCWTCHSCTYSGCA